MTDSFARSKTELLDKVLADDFILLDVNGLLYKKQEVLEQLQKKADTNTTDSYRIENLTIRYVAADVAMVHGITVSTFKDGKKTATQCNNIFVNRGGRWICVSGNNTPIRN